MATNKVRAATMKLFREREMLEYFDYIICADDVTKMKPDPECIFTVLDHFGLKPEDAVLVGDTPTDVLTARNAGVDTIGVTYGMASGRIWPPQAALHGGRHGGGSGSCCCRLRRDKEGLGKEGGSLFSYINITKGEGRGAQCRL